MSLDAELTHRGVTLIEVLIASMIALVIVLALGQVDITRIYLTQEVRQRTRGPSEAMLALQLIIKGLEQADRVEALGAGCIGTIAPLSCLQFRIPTGTSFDDPDNYRWVQYHFASAQNQIRFYDDIVKSGCGTAPDMIFWDLSGFEVNFRDESPTPPGGVEPLAPSFDDSNVLVIAVSWRDTSDVVRTFTGQATMRAGAYTNLRSGLAPDVAAFDPPSTPCP